MPDTIMVRQGAILDIDPVITQQVQPDEGSLSFQWIVTVPGKTATDSSNDVISGDKHVKVRIEYLSGSYYPLILNVKDARTGIVYKKRSQMRVITDFEPGYMVLEQLSDHADISFVNTSKDTVIYRAFSAANPSRTLPVDAGKVFVYDIPAYNVGVGNTTYGYPKTAMMSVLYGNDGYILNYRTMEAVTPYSLFFQQTPDVVSPGFFQLDIPNPPRLLTINNGKLHRLFMDKGQSLFGPAYLAPDSRDYHLAPFTANTANTALYFDVLNHRFLSEGYMAVALDTMYYYSDMAFDPRYVDKQILTMGLGPGGTMGMALFKDNDDDDCWLYVFNYGNPAYSLQLQNSPGLTKSPAYLFSKARNQFYFADGNTLYLYDISANAARAIYTFDAGETITTLTLPDQQTIAAATWNGSSGKLFTIPLTGTGDVFNNTYAHRYDAFGKIVSIAYKQ